MMPRDHARTAPRRDHSFARFFTLLFLLSWIVIFGCGDDDGAVIVSADTTPPSAVTDFLATPVTFSSALLTWSAPGDDSASGDASTYSIRYSTHPDTAAHWWDSLCTPIGAIITPAHSGDPESHTVTGLRDSTTYYFALRSADEAANWSALSNVSAVTTAARPDTVVPVAISDLDILTVTDSSVQLTWTVPGDLSKGASIGEYAIRYSTEQIDEMNWSAARRVIYHPDTTAAAQAESVTISGLVELTTYYFAVKSADEARNWSPISNVAAATTSESDLRRTIEGLFEFFEIVYSQRDSTGYSRILDDHFEFLIWDHFCMTDPVRWGRSRELILTGHMFNGWENPGGISVLDIDLNLTVDTLSEYSGAIYPDKPLDETWWSVECDFDLLVVTADSTAGNGSGIVNRTVQSAEAFVVKPDQHDPGFWSVRHQTDNLNDEAPDSWGDIKRMF